MTHIDDWLDTDSENENEEFAKNFFEHCRRPAIEKDHEWIHTHVLLCDYQGKTFRAIGASHMGDIWLTKSLISSAGYELRVDVADCTNWREGEQNE